MKRPIILRLKQLQETSGSEKIIAIFVLAFILPLIILLIITSAFAMDSYQQQAMQTMERMASYFLAETDDSLHNIEKYLVKNASENYDFGRIAYDQPQSQSDSEYQLYKTRFYQSLRQNIDLYPGAQYFFLYQQDWADLLLVPCSDFSTQSSVSYSDMTDYLSGYLAESPVEEGQWTLLEVNGEKQLFRTFRFGNTYLGANVPVNLLLGKLEKYNLNNCGFQISDSYMESNGLKSRRLPFTDAVIHLNSSQGDYSISLIINHRSFFTPAMIVYCAILLLSLLLLGLVPISRRLLEKQFYVPLKILVHHMKKIEDGQTDERLPARLGGPEMTQVAGTFNQMMEQIQLLKIQVYEEKLAQSRLELQCLHLQLNPHFFLNTLNTAYLLVKAGELDNLQSLLKSLTGYFRSVFQSSSDSTQLSMELEQCKNYICAYQIRCFKSIQVVYNIDESLLDCYVPPMCILTFLENSIKYAMENLDALCITTTVRRLFSDEQDILEITVQDNGTGYSADILDSLNQEFAAQPLTGSHIGIRNLQHRLYYYYRGTASISFSNAKEGGARTVIRLPFDSTQVIRRDLP